MAVFTAEELLHKQIEPPRFIVNNLISEGLTVLASAPKMGKSWLSLQLCTRVAEGKPFLHHKTQKCDVLYMALEDSQRRLQTRLIKQLGDDYIGIVPQGLRFETEVKDDYGKRLSWEEFKKHLKGLLKVFPDTGLIVIDTLQKIKPPDSRNRSAYDQDYETLGDLQKIALDYGIAIVVVHHTRKSTGYKVYDPFQEIMGSTAIQGTADTMIILSKEDRFDNEATLSVTGRDIECEPITIQQTANCTWVSLGSSEELARIKLEMEYNSHLAIKVIKYKLEEAQRQTGSGIYEASPKDIWNESISIFKEVIPEDTRQFKTILTTYKSFLKEDNISYSYIGNTTRGGKRGKYYQFKYI